VPEDVGGTPSFPDGWEPDDDRDRGGADEEFASVVFDEDFVQAAKVHEPTAVERLLAAAQARAEASEAEARRARTHGSGRDSPDDDLYEESYGPDDGGEFGHDPDLDDVYDREFAEDGYGRRGRYSGHNRWHRPVAWMLALLMGVGMVALAFTAVYRGGSSGRQDPIPPPVSTEPSASAEYAPPPVSATPRTP
jgi:hypothetical protein